eukprot:gb/GFBE01007623.1/.p1 GENE.gb/GFBE01007623.1/~~gb/GFBE01007623.1/.p1  ORF type:complete len:385 (+),score=73.07 gb/GFBE01007623.1/:1-1155(+)
MGNVVCCSYDGSSSSAGDVLSGAQDQVTQNTVHSEGHESEVVDPTKVSFQAGPADRLEEDVLEAAVEVVSQSIAEDACAPLTHENPTESVDAADGVDSESEVEIFLREITRLVEADEIPRDKDNAGLAASGWREISKPTAKVFYKAKRSPARDCLFMGIESQDQVPWLPLLEVKDGKIACGAIPTLWATPHWPLWFPFCESNVLLRRFSPSSFICKVTLKVMFLTLDFVLFVCIKDKLHTAEGILEVFVKSPPLGSENQEWMGITVPPKTGSLPRICVRHSRIQVRPTGPATVSVNVQAELDDVSGAPEWVKTFIFQQLAVRIIPELVKFQRKIPGSPLDEFLNGAGEQCAGAEDLEFIRGLHRSIEKFVADTSRSAAAPSPKL